MGSLLTVLLITLLAIPGAAAADAVTDWNEVAGAAAATARQGGTDASRTTALVHTAIFDAANAVDPRYTPYKVKLTAPAGASAEAAAVAAAHAVLVRLYPDQKASLDQAYAKSLERIGNGSARTDGIGVGQKVGADMVALRANDGATAPNTYRPVTAPGVYTVTTLPVATQWGKVTPWALERGAQFRPGPPSALSSGDWARDYMEIMDLGGKKSSVRTPEQTEIARFWTVVGPASWDPVLRAVAGAPGRTLSQNARLFALAEMAAADAYIAVFEAVLEAEFGSTFPEVTMKSPTAPGVVRRWTSARAFADEVAAARIYGGIHYRTSTVVGQQMGKQIGDFTVQRYLKPVR